MFARELLDSVLQLPGEFAAVGAHDPLSALLLAIGTVLVGVTVAVGGYLVVGALVEWLTPTGGGAPEQPGG